MAKRKNPAAQALGRLGGSKNTEAQNRARRRNARKGGRPHEYRMEQHPNGYVLYRREEPVRQLSTAALLFLAKWIRENKPRQAIAAFTGRLLRLERKER